MLLNKIKLHLTVTFLLTATISQFLSFIYKVNITSHWYQLPLIGYSPAWLIKPIPLFPLRIPMVHGNRKWRNLTILSFHFHYPSPISSVPTPFSAFTVALAPSGFLLFIFCFPFFTSSLPLSGVLLPSPRNGEKSTEPLIGSVNPVKGTRTLMGCVG